MVKEHPLPSGYIPICLGSAEREPGKNAHLPVYPWRRFDCILSQLLPESLASNQLVSSILLFGTLMVLAYSQLLRATKNKDGSLGIQI